MFEHLRGRPRRTFRDDEPTPRALFFVVDDTRVDGEIAPEREIVQAAVRAQMAILTDPATSVRDAVQAWLNGRIRKIVKRARGSAFRAVVDSGLPVHVIEIGQARVAAFAPMALDAQPRALHTRQVSGLQSQDTAPADIAGAHLLVTLDGSLNMSTGKKVAQVGHAAQLFAMYAPLTDVHAWAAREYAVSAPAADGLWESNGVIAVHDAGFTEVPQGALTATARWVAA